MDHSFFWVLLARAVDDRVGVCVYVYVHTPTPPSTLAMFSTRLDYGPVSSVRPLGFVLHIPYWCVVSFLPPPSVPRYHLTSSQFKRTGNRQSSPRNLL